MSDSSTPTTPDPDTPAPDPTDPATEKSVNPEKAVNPEKTADPAKARRRALAISSLLLAIAAICLWAASRMTWATVVGADGMSPPRTFRVHGSDWSPWLTPLAIVLVAAIAATAALRGWLQRLVAVIVAVIGVVVMIPAISLLTSGDNTSYAAKAIEIPARYQVLQMTTNSWSAVVAILGGLCAIVAAISILRVGRTGTSMSSKYLSPGARRAELERQVFADRAAAPDTVAGDGRESARVARDDSAEHAGDAESTAASGSGTDLNERMLWDALDTGEDPTDRGR